MRVLIVNSNPYDKNLNPYIRTIIEGVKNCDSSVQFEWGYEKFWNDEVFSFDIIHFMFPDMVLTNGRNANDLQNRLEEIKNYNKKIFIVSTCHNFEPHTSKNVDRILAHKIVYSVSCQIYHLGGYSLDLFEKEYLNAKNLLLEHPVYDKEFSKTISKSEALNFLDLKTDRKYVLCLGSFRSKKERDMIIALAKKVRKENIFILAPSFYHYFKRRNLIAFAIKFIKYCCYAIYGKIFFPNLIFTGKNTGCFISDELIPYYYGASDVALIQRFKILNSGNLPMGFLFGRPICGPDLGNVGEILRNHNNFVFDAENLDSIYDALHKALQQGESVGIQNREFALANWNTDLIGKKQLGYYNMLN